MSQRIKTNRRSPHARRGAVFVIMIVVVLLVVLTAWQSMIRGEILSRSKQRDRADDATLVRAIEIVRQVDQNQAKEKPVTLPVGDAGDQNKQRIEVIRRGDVWTATWMLKDETLRSVSRTFPESS